MIDREGRDKLAERLRHLAAAVISNYQFEDTERRSSDGVVAEIEFRLAWPTYDDLHEHRLVGRTALSLGQRLDFARAILFLKTNLPYEWNLQTGPRGFLNSCFRLFRLSRKPSLAVSIGDLRVWPFFRKSDYQAALSQPPYLKGVEAA